MNDLTSFFFGSNFFFFASVVPLSLSALLLLLFSSLCIYIMYICRERQEESQTDIYIRDSLPGGVVSGVILRSNTWHQRGS